MNIEVDIVLYIYRYKVVDLVIEYRYYMILYIYRFQVVDLDIAIKVDPRVYQVQCSMLFVRVKVVSKAGSWLKVIKPSKHQFSSPMSNEFLEI